MGFILWAYEILIKSADFCLIVALSPMDSIYLYDLDGNMVDIGVYTRV